MITAFRMTLICVGLCLVLGIFPSASPAAAGGPTEPVASFTYQLDDPGRVSAAIYDQDGRLLRELLRGQKQEAGEHTLHWDGLDRDGHPMEPGTYEVRLLRMPGFKAEYKLNLGIRPGTQPYDTWPGNHSGAAGVAVDSTGMYVCAEITETACVILKQTLDGKKRFWEQGRNEVTDGRFQGGAAVTSDGEGNVYMLQQNGLIQVMDAETGRLRVDVIGRDAYRGALGSSARFGRDRPPRTWDPLPQEVQDRIDERHEVRQIYKHGHDTIGGADIAADGDVFVISFRDQNSVRWLSLKDGSVEDAVDVPSPLGVAVAPDGDVYVISEKKVLAVKRDGTKRTVVEELVHPVRLTFDPANDDLLVAERDPDNRIKRFNLQGKLKAAYGREGGRREGPYDPQNFLGVTDIAADLEGGFIVAEERPAPRRVARFNENGKLVVEWYGGQPYYAWGEPDPRNPSRVWFNPGGWLTLAELDYENHTWEVLENYRQSGLGDGLVQTVTGHRGRWQVLYRGDQRFLIAEGDPQVLVHEDGSLRPFCVVTNDKKRVEKAVEIAGYDGDAASFRWVDDNGDGQPQAGEISFSESGRVPSGERGVAGNFELLDVTSGRDAEGQIVVQVVRTAPRWTDAGPVYPFGDEAGINEVAGEAPTAGRVGTGGTRGVGAFRDSAGNYYAHYNAGGDRHGTRWPTYWGGETRLVKWAPAGDVRWKVGRHAIHGGLGRNPHTTPPGYMHVPAAIIGEVHDCVAMTDRVEWMGMVWTKDGLYVGNVLDGRVDDGLPDKVYYWWRTPEGEEAIITSDNATGGALVEADDGSVYFFTQGRNSVPVYRIHGWEDWTRRNGSMTLDAIPPHADAQGPGLNAAYYRGLDLAGEPDVRRVDTRLWHGIPRRNPGHHPVLDCGVGASPAYDWSKSIEPLGLKPGDEFAVRWTGEFEAPLTEEFTFSVYHRGGVRLWIDGEQKVSAWDADGKGRQETEPMSLQAGHRYSVRVEYRSAHEHPTCSLNWESPSLDRQRIPGRYLYGKD